MNRAALWAAIFALVLVSGDGLPAFAQQSGTTEIVGGGGGSGFSDPGAQAGARVLEVQIRSGDKIDSVRMVIALADGRSVANERRGGSGGGLNTFRLDSGEYITGLSGRCGDYIDSLRIHTNKRTSPLFGGRGGGREYRIDVPSGNQAIGFAGRAGDFLDAVGLIYVPVRQVQINQTTIAGGGGGSEFADREIAPDARIVEVRVRAGDRIDSIQAIYGLPDGRIVEGERHGGRGGRSESFRLDPDEYITGLSGRHGDQVDSLRIHTNKRTSQVFGGGGGRRDYRIDVPAGSLAVGFVGRSGGSLDAIGLAHSPLKAPSRRRLGLR